MQSLSVRALVLVGLVAGPLGAQMVWRSVSGTGPSPRTGHAMAFDAVRGRVVLFGGRDSATSSLLGDTWEWDGVAWMHVPIPGPVPRECHAMAFDSLRQRVVLFGGSTGLARLGDTWTWDGLRWIQASAAGPSARSLPGMTYHTSRQRVVLGGGHDGTTSRTDLWDWDGTAWTNLPSTGAPAIGRLVYDAARGQLLTVVIWYDRTNQDPWTRSTLEWRHGVWRSLHPASCGPWPYGFDVAYDSERQRVVLVREQHTEEWDGVTWTRGPGMHPSWAPWRPVHDAARGQIVLFCPASQTARCETWAYEPTTRGDTARVGIGCPGSSGTPTLTSLGPPISGNRDFGLEMGSVPSNANVFVGLSMQLAATRVPPCWIYPRLPFLDVLTGTSRVGTAELPLPIPWNTSLSGASLFVQGGALDAGGALLGALSLTPAMQVRIGD